MSSAVVDVARLEALFVWAAQVPESELPPPAQIRLAVAATIRAQGGAKACAAEVAAQFGDHPERAVRQMRRAHDLLAAAYPSVQLATLVRRSG